MIAHRPRSYALLFATHLLTLLLSPFLPASSPLGDLLFLFFLLIFVSALPAAAGRPWLRGVFATLAIVLVGSLAADAVFGPPRVWLGVGMTAAAILFGLLVYLVLADVARAEVVTMDTIYGASTAYLALGLLWASLYTLTNLLQPGAFATAAAPPRLDDFVYYSYVTLTTLGYGDVVPVSRPARGLAVIEALVGQLYLAVMLARLVGLQTADEMRRRG